MSAVIDSRIWAKSDGFVWFYIKKGDPKTYLGTTRTRQEAEEIIALGA
jgi:hypothetical protein